RPRPPAARPPTRLTAAEPRGGRPDDRPLLRFAPMFAVRRHAVFRQASGIPGPIELLREAIAELLSRRQLIRYLVGAEMKKRGSDTILGNLWWILDPILQMVVYVVFVTILAPRPAPDYPLFIFAA